MTEHKFRIGDKVKCIKKGMQYLTEGKIYTVLLVSGDMVKITRDNGDITFNYAHRFILARKEKFYK